MLSMPVLVPINDRSPSVTAHPCSLSPDPASTPLKTMQATIMNSLWTYPPDQITCDLHSLRKSTMRTFLCCLPVPNQSGMPLSNMSTTQTSSMALDRLVHRSHHHSDTLMRTWVPPTLTMIPHLSLVTQTQILWRK